MTELFVYGCIFSIYAIVGYCVFFVLKKVGFFEWLKNTMIGSYLWEVWGL